MLSISSPDFDIIQEPNGLRALEHRVYFSPDIRGYIEEWKGTLTFFGDEYLYLRNEYFVNACSIVPVVLSDSEGRNYNANLFLNEATWRPDMKRVELEVVDAGFLSLIDSNMEIKAYLNVPRSKNDVDISAFTTTQTDLTFEASAIADPDVTSREGVRVYDAYKFLIAFMTDGLLEFESDFLTPDDSEDSLLTPVLITADELRNGRSSSDVLYPYISFQSLHKDMANLYNLSFSVVDNVFRVEPDSYFRQTSTPITIDSVDKIEQESDKKSFYALMQFGSQSEESKDFDYYPNITFLGYRKEEYHLAGQCNNKGKLDLRMETLITDPNVIMQSLPIASGGASDPSSDDEDIFLVTCNSSNQSVVYPHPTDTSLQYYNKLLTNFEVSLRWGDGVPFPIYQYLGANQNGARGFLPYYYEPTSQAVNIFNAFGMVKFPDQTLPEGFDPNNNMADAATPLQSSPSIDPLGATVTDTQVKTIYTSPISSVYNASVKIRTNSSVAGSIGFIYLLRYDASPTTSVIDEFAQFTPTQVGGIWEFDLTWSTYLDAGDRLAVGIVNIPNVLNNSFFQVNDLDFIEKTYNPDENYLISSTFNYPTTPEEWRTFLEGRHGVITVTHKGGIVQGYLKEAIRKFENGMTEWKISSTFNNA